MATISNILTPEVRAQALARIGYYDDTRKKGRQVDYPRLLAWFLEFSKKTLAEMSSAKQFSLREEIRALQEEGLRYTENDASVVRHWTQTQEAVAHHLQTVTETGHTHSELFQLKFFIAIPRFEPHLSEQPTKSIYFGEMVEPFNGAGLLYLFFLALKHAGERLRQCPQCPVLFVQARQKQRVCTPRCRQRALRAKQEDQKAKQEKKRSHQTKGARRHGTKRR